MLCFLNCHLAAHMNYASERVDEFEYIMDKLVFDCEKAPKIADHKLVFWFGDLNFRIQDHGMHFVRSCIEQQNYSLLWSKDQLTMMKKKEQRLQEFDEGPLDFQPTYKFDLNSDNYDSSGKKRKPAWTDRILQDLYTCNMEFSISDHKPVTGVFTMEAEGEWSSDLDAVVLYRAMQPFPSSSWDWIGLFKVGFSSVTDYITYTWVKDDEMNSSEEATQVYVSKEEIPVRGAIVCCVTTAVLCSASSESLLRRLPSRKVFSPERIDDLDQIVAGEDFHQ
ncbi:hypothetical protein KUCAC02_032058 [Chaenocephalus aceratus]|nr:hypothetical protein KUCAC02_032058 [Chaenocephalus aceratus]